MVKSKRYRATIFIPTYNGEEYLNDLLTMCFRQKYSYPFEVFIIDSGSTDGTLEIIKRFKKVRLHHIQKQDFSHGKTRQLAAEMSNSDFIVFLTQDAVPAHEQWLSQILYPFEIGDRIIAVLGRQIPRSDAMPITKRDVGVVFGELGPGHFITIQSNNPLNSSAASQGANIFFSNVNSAIRRDFLIKEFGIPPVSYAEDMAFSKKLIENGWFKAYSPQGSVLHTHTYSVHGYYERMVAETQALVKQQFYKSTVSSRLLIGSFVWGVRKDVTFILKDKDYSFRRKVKWLIKTPEYNAARQLAIYRTVKNHFNEATATTGSKLDQQV